jgi:protoporphyrinogen oxidase
LTPFETAGTAARFGSAWVRRQIRPRQTETVADWGARVLGRSATGWLLAPALQGIYAAPPSELSAAALFGKSRPRGGKLAAPAHGMGELIDALVRALQQKGIAIEFNRGVRPEDVDFSQPTVICTNAPSAAALLAGAAPDLSAALSRIRMVSIVIATAFFAPHDADLRGFGVLFPRASGVRALGALFNAEIFIGRGTMRSETWIYGDLDPARLPGDDTETRSQLSNDREVLTGRREAPVATYVTRQIHALPVYDAAVLDAQAALAALPPHLAVAGNYAGRLGVSSLLDGASDAAARVWPRRSDRAGVAA